MKTTTKVELKNKSKNVSLKKLNWQLLSWTTQKTGRGEFHHKYIKLERKRHRRGRDTLPHYLQRITIKLTADFSMETIEARRHWNEILSVERKNVAK